MIILDSTVRSLEIDLTSTVTTNQLPFMVAWVDHTASAYTPGSTLGQTNNTTAVTIVAAPGASTQRSIKYINVKNNDTVAAEVTIQYNDNATLRELVEITLQPEDTLQYVDTEGWSVIDTSGQKKTLASVTVISALPAGTNNIGDVDVLSLPSIPTGSNNIGDVDVLSLPSIPAGTNNIGDVDVLTLPSIPAGTNNIGDVDIVSLPNEGQQTMANSISIAIASDQSNVPISGTVTASNVTGNIAHDSADSGNPVKIGHRARTSDIAVVAQDDRVDSIADSLGKRVVLLGCLPNNRLQGNQTYTTTTATDVIAAQGAGVRIVVTGILVTNAHATVSTKVEIRDGTTVRIQGHARSDGGGFSMQNPGGIFTSTANTAVTARCVTTGADVDVSIQGYSIAN